MILLLVNHCCFLQGGGGQEIWVRMLKNGKNLPGC